MGLQVSFYIFIPAMLFAKVASTLSAQPSAQLLGTIVVVTLAQVRSLRCPHCVW